jgi:hypothetical protein
MSLNCLSQKWGPVQTVWARYGASFDPQDRDASTLLRITHWNEAEIRRTYSAAAFEPDYTIDAMEELKQIVPDTVMSLFEGVSI